MFLKYPNILWAISALKKKSSASLNLVVTNPAPGGTVNLTTLGTVDWRVWGYSGSTTQSQYYTGGAISDYTTLTASTVNAYGGVSPPFTWTNGNPVSSATAEQNGIFTSGTGGNGFQIILQSTPSIRNAYLYFGGYQCNAQLSGSFPTGETISSGPINYPGANDTLFQLQYSHPSSKPLTIKMTQLDSAGNVTINASAVF